MDGRIYMPEDIAYMRFTKGGEVFRVARVDTIEGLVLALYPSRPGFFHTEAFRESDDTSPREEISISNVGDDVWIGLLNGEKIEKILSNYEPIAGDGSDNRGSYYYAGRGTNFNRFRKRTFHICDDTREEDVLDRARSSKIKEHR